VLPGLCRRRDFCFTADMPPMFVIVNPASDNGSTARYWPKAEKTLTGAGLELDVVYTEGPGHASALAQRAGEEGYRIVLYVGGDGTANEVANGLLCVPSSARPALAALPRGTGGDFTKSMGMESGAQPAAERLLRGAERTIDVAVAGFLALTGEHSRRYYLNIADVGLGGFVAERVNRTSKAFGGFASFLYSTVATFWNLDKPEMSVEIDGTTVFVGPATTVAVCNGPRFGGGMLMAPDAQPDDAVLDIILIGDVTKVDLALNLPRLYRGTHLTHPKVHAFRGREVKVTAETDVPLEIDGEHPGTTPFHVWVEPGALRVVV
jgi:diacylglycerol kinase (ATP)